MAKSERFLGQLMDAAASYAVGAPWDGASRIRPLIGPAEGKLLRALTTLDEGESWRLEPRQLDDTGALWTPGIREGVRPGSEYHLTECFGPVLGVMTARTLDEAIDYVNAIDYCLTSGLHSVDDNEIRTWLGRVEAGNAYVNLAPPEPSSSASRRRLEEVGRLVRARRRAGRTTSSHWGSWTDATPTSGRSTDEFALRAITAARDAGASEHDVDWLAAALATDAVAWADEFGAAHDVTGLAYEQNVLRHLPVPVTVRFEGQRLVELVRVVAAVELPI